MKMVEKRLYQLIGLAERARKLTSGEEQVVREIKRKRASLVLISSDASWRTKKKMKDKCNHYDVKIAEVGDRYKLGRAIGKEERVVLAVLDDGFAKQLLIHLGQ